MSIYLLIGPTAAAIATDLESARHVIAAQPGSWKPTGALTTAFDGLPTNLTYLSVTDPKRCSLPEAIAGVPNTVQTIMKTIAIGDELDEQPLMAYLELFGIVPPPGQKAFRLDRSKTPKVEDLRRLVFPSVLATAVDDRGYRIIHRQPFPFAGLTSELTFEQKWSLDLKGFARPDAKYKVSFTSPRFPSRD